MCEMGVRWVAELALDFSEPECVVASFVPCSAGSENCTRVVGSGSATCVEAAMGWPEGSSPEVSTRHLGRIVDTSTGDWAPPGAEEVRSRDVAMWPREGRLGTRSEAFPLLRTDLGGLGCGDVVVGSGVMLLTTMTCVNR